MTRAARYVLAAAALLVLSGCSTMNNILGETDNTVLPGQREDAIPGRPSFPEKRDVAVGTPGTAGGGAAASSTSGTAAPSETYCAPEDPDCKPPATTGDTFSDPQ
jgi:putative hemolysin